MTRKQLKVLISTGVFSAALLSGAAYADDPSNSQTGVQVSSDTPHGNPTEPSAPEKHATTTSKDPAPHGCAGAGGCGGK